MTLTIINCSGSSAEIGENYDVTFVCFVSDENIRLWRFQQNVGLNNPMGILSLLNARLVRRKATEDNFPIKTTSFGLYKLS